MRGCTIVRCSALAPCSAAVAWRSRMSRAGTTRAAAVPSGALARTRSISLVAALLARDDRARVDSGRPASARARRVMTAQAREALAADPRRSLGDLARELAVSPHHLSRVFRAGTGETISRHRIRLRT